MHLMDKAEKAEHAAHLASSWGEKRFDSWLKYYMEDDYIALDDGVVIAVDHPGIDSDIWYDDECVDPLGDTEESRKAGFMEHNLDRKLEDFGLAVWRRCRADLEDHGCCSGLYVSEPFVAVWGDGTARPVFLGHEDDFEANERRGMTRRPLSAEELGQLVGILDDLKARYVRRLETYWKRYSGKVASHGYWANR